MSRLIDLGCRIAEVHHRYDEIHGTLFGAASFRLIFEALRGRRQRTYREYIQTLKALRGELESLEPRLAELSTEYAAKASEREMRTILAEYLRALDGSIASLVVILENLAQDESAYRALGDDGRSGFTRDKLNYDHSLSELERLGTRLNRLFANY